MVLFENKIRKDFSPSKHIDDLFDFCDRNAQPKVNRIRNILNHWFSHYPENEQHELKCRLQKEFYSALYELFLHELFLNQGFDITIHPKLPDTEKTPDFLLSKDGKEFYLEAKVFTRSNATKSEEQRLNNLYDSLNKIESPNFFLGIKDIQLKSAKQPSAKEIIKTVEAELLKYDVNVIRNKTLQELPYIPFENQDIKILFYLIPKSESKCGEKGIRPIAVYHSFSKDYEDISINIKRSLEKKANRYGTLNKPYLIAINSMDMIGEYDADDAIWGAYPHAKNGFFLDHSGIRHAGVGGVLITEMNLGSIHDPKYWLYKHPWAKHEVNFDLMELSYCHVSLSEIKNVNKKRIGNILNQS